MMLKQQFWFFVCAAYVTGIFAGWFTFLPGYLLLEWVLKTLASQLMFGS